MKPLVGLIPAAGRGVRARPFTKSIPKSMLEINGTPNLQKNIEIMRDDLGIRDIYVVIGHLGKVIRKYFEDGSSLGVRITYIENRAIEKGLAYSILLGREYISDYFCVILSDESYINSNHEELTLFPYQKALITCAIKHIDDHSLIRRNYTCELDGERIVRLVEKPKEIKNNILGCGTFIISPDIFPLLEQAFEQSRNGYVEYITFIDELCQRSEKVFYFNLKGSYTNINDRDSLNLAKYHQRRERFSDNTVILLLYAEGDEKNITFSINQYKRLSDIDSVYVILPDDSSIEAEIVQSGASIIKCPPGKRLYGEKIKYALEQVSGDILLISEADYSFPARDISKLLVYLKEADMVVGTRTTRQLIEQGSDMQGVVRMANVLLAKLMEIFWWNYESRFTDVGCTFRAIWKSTFDDIQERLIARGPEFSAEMMIEVLHSRGRMIEIPVNYFNRSVAMQKKYRNLRTFFRFFILILRKRLSV